MKEKTSLTVTFENLSEKDKDALLFLFHTMEIYGSIGHSSELKFFADGDGDFRPKVKNENGNKIQLPDYIGELEKEYLYKNDIYDTITIDPDTFYFIKHKLPIIRLCRDNYNYYLAYAPNNEYITHGLTYHIGDIIMTGSGYYLPGIKKIEDATLDKLISYGETKENV